jgi:gluconolactonase
VEAQRIEGERTISVVTLDRGVAFFDDLWRGRIGWAFMKLKSFAPLALVGIVGMGIGCESGSVKRPPLMEIKNDKNASVAPRDATGTMGQIERLDPALDALLAPDAKVEVLVKGLDWAEGPVWSRREKSLLWSDVPQNIIYSWNAKDGVRGYLKPSGYWGQTARAGEPGSNGLTFDHQGRLVICQHGERRVARLEKDGTIASVVDHFEGKRFNSPNDLVYDRHGDLYFTDPAYGLEGNLKSPLKEIPFQGVYKYSADGKLSLFSKEIKFPNGIAFSPDEKILYVAASDPDKPVIWAFDRPQEGDPSAQPRVFFDASSLVAKKLKGMPDGLKVDVRGNIFLGGPGGILIISPAGKHLGTISTGELMANCAWGDDGSTLYVTADGYIVRIRTKTRGRMP